MSATRLTRLRQCMEEQQVAAVAVNAGPTLTYLTGLHFHLMERPVVVIFTLQEEPTIILPELELRKLEGLNFPLRVHAYGENPADWPRVFSEALRDPALSGGKVGVEPRQLRFLEYEYLRAACRGGDFVDGSTIVNALRAKKDSREIDCMRRAVKIAEDALEATLARVKIGISEKELAGELLLQLINHGSDIPLPFSPIVAAGPNSANPHSQPSDRLLAAGDLLLVDWGASYNGYVSDLTRTFAIGKLDPLAEKIHTTVQQANSAGRAAGGPGVACGEVDRATRRVIEAAGFAANFTHRTGHGLGMECHEDPYIRSDNEQLLEVGMTYTVEPGIYLPGFNGVRIEDDMVVTEAGAESLSTMAREIRILC